MNFLYKTDRTPDSITLHLAGRLDTLSAEGLENEVKAILNAPAKKIEVDLSSLSYISSSGLRCLVELLKGSRATGAEMSVTGVQRSIREIFDLTGLSKIFGLQ